jgi:uncharacterized protein
VESLVFSSDLTCLVPERTRLPDRRPGPAAVLRSRLGVDAFAISRDGGTYVFSPITRSFGGLSPRLVSLLGGFDGVLDTTSVLQRAGHAPDAMPVIDMLVRMGVLWSEELGRLRPTKPAGPEPVLTVMPTTACQLRCVYCCSDAGDPQGGRFVDPRVFGVALDAFLAEIFHFASRARLGFHGGGEPTLNPRLMRELVRTFVERCEACWLSPSFTLTTNGMFGDETCRLLIDNRFDCRVSLDGPADVQDSQRPLRGSGASFQRVIGNIRKLVAEGIRVEIRPTVTAASVGRMVETIEMAAAEGIASVHFARALASERARVNGIEPPDHEAFAAGFTAAGRRALELGVAIKGEGSHCTALATNRFCGACGFNWIVTAHSYVSACTEIQGPADPDSEQFLVARVDPERQVLETVPGLRDRLRQRSVDNLPDCADCWLKYSCAGECPLEAHRANGDMMKTKSTACDAIRRMNADHVALLVDSSTTRIPSGLREPLAYERFHIDL